MADRGWITIHRKIQDCAIWNFDEPFDKRSAWIDLILMANHEDREIIVNNHALLVKRGQKFTSVRHLAEKWAWSEPKVLRYLNLLISCGMITKDSTRNGTLITIEKYSDYQDVRNTNRNTDVSTGVGTAVPKASHRRLTNNNVNNENNGNNETKEAASPPLMWGGHVLE